MMVKDPVRHREEQRRYRAKHLEKIRAKERDPAFKEKKQARARDPVLQEKMRAESREPDVRERKKRWKLENPEKVAAAQLRYRAKNKESLAAYNKAWALANPDKILAYGQNQYAEHREEILAATKIRYFANRDRILKQQAGHRLKVKSINAIRHNPEDVYRVVSRAVSSALPRFMRDDVINSMLLAVLEGKLLLEHVATRMKEYVSGYNREYDTFKTLSLDAPMGGTDLRRIDLLEAPAPYEPEEDEEEDSDLIMLRGGFRF